MSDDDFMMEDGEEDFDFEYEDEEGDTNISLENQYYAAKGVKSEDPESALAEFRACISAEDPKGEWGFKCLKQSIKLHFRANQTALTLELYRELLGYTLSAVSRNYAEKSLNNILDLVAGSSDMGFLADFYEETLKTLQETKNERLWTKTNLKLAKLWLDRKEYARLSKILKELHASVQSDAVDDQRRGTLLMEIYALEIQMYTDTLNNKKLKQVYQDCLLVKSGLSHPRIMGVIRECGGKMHMSEKDWANAQIDFFEAFKNYDEAGSPQRIHCLKYMVLANMLMESSINPFESQEVKPYKNDPQITPMTLLVSAYERKEIHEFERVLRENRGAILEDVFMKTYIDDLLKNIRSQALIKLIRPYTRIDMSFAARQLNVDLQQVEDLMVTLILDSKVNGRIDQIHQRLELDSSALDAKRYDAMGKWSTNVDSLYKAIVHKAMA